MGNVNKDRSLTRRQQIFCQEYLVDFNATRAAKAAGYKAKNLSVAGSEILRNPKVQTFVKARIESRSQNATVSFEEW